MASGACRRPAAVALLALALAGCVVSNGPSSVPPGGSPAGAITTGQLSGEDAILAYGYGATRNAQVTYQPDVVIVEGGPSIIRGVSGDGLTWAIDRNARGAADLKVGSVMFATSRAAGRVDDIRDEGDSRIVTLEPINLTDLVSDANLQINQDINPQSMAYQVIPDLPGAVSEPDATTSPPPSAAGPGSAADGEEVISLPPIRLVAAGGPANGLPPPLKACPEVSTGSWAVKPCLEPGRLSLGIDYKPGAGLKFGGVITLLASNLRVRSNVAISGGTTTSSSVVIDGIDGLDGLDITLFGGVQRGSADNAKVKIEVPVESYYPIPPSPATLGLPLTEYVEWKFIIETAFSGNNSTLQAHGSYSLSGSIGVDGGSVQSPSLRVVNSIIDSLKGVTLGPSGVVAAVRFKFQAGIGVYGAVAGPYGFLTVSVGVTKGSVLGAPVADCRNATLGLWTGVGAGVQVDLKALAILLPAGIQKLKLENEVNVNVFSARQTLPDIPICRG